MVIFNSYVSLPEGISSVMISNYTHIYISHIPPSAPGAGPSTCAAPATRRGPWPGPNRTLASPRCPRFRSDLWVDLWQMHGTCTCERTSCLFYLFYNFVWFCRVSLALKRIRIWGWWQWAPCWLMSVGSAFEALHSCPAVVPMVSPCYFREQ